MKKCISRRDFLKDAAMCVAWTAWAGSAAPAETSRRKPNFVVILADDLGYGDVGCYGNRANQTPSLDRLAAEGMRFSDFHSNGPMCSPTRAALLTGRYQQRMGIETALGKNEKGLIRREVTIAERLRDAGYTTAIFGKWHLGDRPADNPRYHGFDEFRGHTYGDSDYISHVDRHGDLDWWHNLQLENEEGYNTTLLTDYAVRFIRENRNRPFFLYVSHSAIHFPWMTPEDTAHRKRGTDYTTWHADMPTTLSKLGPHEDVGPVVKRMIQELDTSVGRIVGELRKQGLAENTLVFFVSDNGGYLHYGGLHRGEISSNGPLRGQKGDVFEGGHRVPAIAWWPGRIQPGIVTDATTMTMDLMPTFLELAGLEIRTDDTAHTLDGTSLTKVLLQNRPLPDRPLFWRIRDERAVRLGPWKLVRVGQAAPMLFNLADDLGETLDLAAERPELVRQLWDACERWERDVSQRINVDNEGTT